MKNSIVFLSLGCLAWMAPLKAEAATFSQLYVFGDSLVDAGNFYQLSSSSPLSPIPIPQSPPYNERFTNGLTWVEYLAASIPTADGEGLMPTLSTSLLGAPAIDFEDGVYFGFGGAGTDIDNIVLPPLVGTGAKAQVLNTYGSLFSIPGFEPADDALFVYQAGANDLAGSSLTPPVLEKTAVENLVEQNVIASLQFLIDTGAKNILISNLPDISQTPRFLGQPAAPEVSQAVKDFNSALTASVGQLSITSPEVNFIEFDFDSLLQSAIAGNLGFSNVTSPCLTEYTFPIDVDGFVVCDQPDQYLFWDDFHPTDQANQLIAAAAIQQIHPPKSVPEPTSILGILALGAGTALYARKQQSA